MLPLRIVVALLLLGGTAAAEGPKRVLLVTHAGGYMHDSGLVAERFRRVRVLMGGLRFWRLGSMPCWKRYPLPISPVIRGATQVGPESSPPSASPYLPTTRGSSTTTGPAPGADTLGYSIHSP